MSSERSANLMPLGPIATLVGWAVCLAAGVAGLALGYPRPTAQVAAELPPTQIVEAQLAAAPAPPPQPVPLPPPAADTVAPASESPAPAPAPVAAPASPALAAVAPPTAAVAFALPTEGLTRIVDPGQAGYTRQALPVPSATGTPNGTGGGPPAPPPQVLKPAVRAAPAVVQLSLGEGEGTRINPQYPRAAQLAGQQGAVRVQFVVSEDGRVLSAALAAPSRWPLLNQEALRAVRATVFSPAAQRRIFEVPIEFQLNP